MADISTEAFLLKALADTQAATRRGELDSQLALGHLAGYIEQSMPKVSRALLELASAARDNDTLLQVRG